ncbi:hypothetical protein BS47DRAFT_1351987 [Hydnum rufescens UP504]|uniref:Calcineurin-like phosphoesterase domain-containing protein n=1 Tax=Hydnum rufescens UP504 TaxID=1448309 RepID=A0A9P6AJT1_9AGAM|nr:hypothetical protein BS47DRAFT_1351987 [Hydnum rufescens UP504]
MDPPQEYIPLPAPGADEDQPSPSYSLSLPRRVLSFTIMTLFILTILALGLVNEFSPVSEPGYLRKMSLNSHPSMQTEPVMPDFSNYGDKLQNLSNADLHFMRNRGRLIIIGDIHGMVNALNKLLVKLNYDSTKDKLVHVGDIITKGTTEGSLAVLSQLAANECVRGNHDQTVIEWRGWFDWVRSYPSGAKWFDSLKDDNRRKRRRPPKKFPIPRYWNWDGEHCRLASRLSDEHYRYLLSLPLVLHLPSLHAHVVHAGLLPLDPTRSPKSGKQPLSHLPFLGNTAQLTKGHKTSRLRAAQEIAVVKEIPQNQDSWVNLNMRSVLDNGVVTKRSDIGRPWAEIWATVLKRCDGFGDVKSTSHSALIRHRQDEIELRSVLDDVVAESTSLVCHPFTVIYGHAAARGLDIKKWSIGLDTGCVYGRRLSADIGEGGLKVESNFGFGNNQGSAKIVSISCR